MSKIPLFITTNMRMKLTDMGFDEILIQSMKPEEAWKILDGKLDKSDYITNKCYELLNMKRPTQKELDDMDLPSLDELFRSFEVPNSNISDNSFNEIKDLGLSNDLNLN